MILIVIIFFLIFIEISLIKIIPKNRFIQFLIHKIFNVKKK